MTGAYELLILNPKYSYRRCLDLLVAKPFEGTPFEQPDDFIEHLEVYCGGCFSVKCAMVGRSIAKMSIKMKLSIIFSICYDVNLRNHHHGHYIKRFMSDLLMGTPDSTRRVFSRLGLCYHPSG